MVKVLMTRMWLIVILVSSGLCGNMAMSHASRQDGKGITLSVKDKPVGTVLKMIEKSNKYVFFYNTADFDKDRVVSIDVKDASLETVLAKLLEGVDNSFQINGRQVYIVKKTALNQAQPMQGKGSGRVSGKVVDEQGLPVPNAAILVKGTSRGIITDLDGNFTIEGVKPGTTLVVNCLGMKDVEFTANDQDGFTIVMNPLDNELDEVTVVAFAKQRKESVIASVTSVNAKDLRVPSSNLTTAFAGRIAGLISYQRSGEPGADDASFFIRGITTFGTGKSDPLILIDGVEASQSQLARMTADNIASFSIMKDANATALYGARGANGVILVNTKEGVEGKTQVSFRSELSLSSPTQMVDVADPVTFMRLQNEAVRTRNPLDPLPFSESKIYNTEKGLDPILYPAVDWYDYLMKGSTMNQRYNFTMRGGGKAARYFVGGSYSRDKGIFKESAENNFRNNTIVNRYSLFSNVNMNLTETTEAIIRLSGQFDESSGPLQGGSEMFYNCRNASPVLFMPYYEPDEETKGLNHILFGNYGLTGNYLNPYAELVKGYRRNSNSVMSAQMELRQDLRFITEGLTTRALFNIKRSSATAYGRSYVPYWYSYYEDPVTGEGRLKALNTNGQEYLSYVPYYRSIVAQMYLETAVQYSRNFNQKHNVGALLVYTMTENLDTQDNLLASLPSRNMGLAGRATYDYDSRYFLEANFGYNGSERFSKSHRWGFFPSCGLGWILSNEPFWGSNLKNTVSKLKLKATYGLVGNDQIGNISDRFFYISQVQMNSNGYTFGKLWDYYTPGYHIARYEDPNIGWEVAHKLNLGAEINLFNDLEIQADYFRERRSDILQVRSYIPSTMGLSTIPSSNIGEARGHGMELSLDYSHAFNNDVWISARGNFTYATSRYSKYEEPDYSTMPWKAKTGKKLSQIYGYVAERLFIDEEEVKNSPVQTFGEYMAGDIKYKDINDDGKIDELDIVPIGFPSTPEIIYGFGTSIGFHGFDLSFFLQGSGRSCFLIDPIATQPFVNGTRAILRYYAEDHWSEDNRDSYALWPRLSTTVLNNNVQASTWWLRNGTFLRIKNVELGYSLPTNVVKKMGMSSLRIYLTGENLAVFSPFKLWDPEMTSGLGYPLQRVFNLGLNVEF